MSSSSSAQALRARLAKAVAGEAGPLVAPGVYDGISTRVAHDVGFEALYMTGAGTTASKLGQPDLALITLPEMVENARMIASIRPAIPLIADADTGFGGPAMVDRTVKAYERAGVAALHIEDQIMTKRCGHLGGKRVVSEEWTVRIKAACLARDPEAGIVIIARTDALAPLSLDAALHRLKLARLAGADAGFLEGLTTESEARRVCSEFSGWPILLNLATNGKTPNWTVAQAAQMGFAFIIFPLVTAVSAMHAQRAALLEVKNQGTDVDSAMGWGPKEFFYGVGLSEVEEIDARAGGGAYESV